MAIAINLFKTALVPMLLVLVTVLSPIIAVPISKSHFQPIAPVSHYYTRPHVGSSTSSLPYFPSTSTSIPRSTVATPFPKSTASFPTGTPRFPTGTWLLPTGTLRPTWTLLPTGTLRPTWTLLPTGTLRPTWTLRPTGTILFPTGRA